MKQHAFVVSWVQQNLNNSRLARFRIKLLYWADLLVSHGNVQHVMSFTSVCWSCHVVFIWFRRRGGGADAGTGNGAGQTRSEPQCGRAHHQSAPSPAAATAAAAAATAARETGGDQQRRRQCRRSNALAGDAWHPLLQALLPHHRLHVSCLGAAAGQGTRPSRRIHVEGTRSLALAV